MTNRIIFISEFLKSVDSPDFIDVEPIGGEYVNDKIKGFSEEDFKEMKEIFGDAISRIEHEDGKLHCKIEVGRELKRMLVDRIRQAALTAGFIDESSGTLSKKEADLLWEIRNKIGGTYKDLVYYDGTIMSVVDFMMIAISYGCGETLYINGIGTYKL